ncbi:MAG: hypothetical protein ACOX0X_00550 [Candidatus Dojkabacteria bacterium]|jgi:hypothetical protein
MGKKSQVIKFIDALNLLIKHKKLNDLPIDYSLQILRRAKEVIPPLEKEFIPPYISEDPRSIYVWSKINLLEQQVMLLIYHKEFIESLNEVPKISNDVNTGNILFSVYDSLAIATRKTLETLLELKGFVKYDNAYLYRIYYCCAEIADKQRRQQDRSVYFKAHSNNLQQQIDFCKDELCRYFDKVSEESIFYLRSKADTGFASISELLKRVAPLLTPEELLMAGYSYQVYSDLSERLHSRTLPRYERIQPKDLDVMYTYLGLLILHTVAVLAELVPEIESKHLDQIRKLLKNNEVSRELHHRYTNNDIKKGDYVVAMRRLARVVKVNTSSFGYNSYKVKFIEPPPIPEYPEDNLKPTEVRFWADGQSLRKQVIDNIGKENLKGKANKELIDKCLDSGALKLMEVLRKAKKRASES